MKTLKESILGPGFIDTKFVPDIKTKEQKLLFEILTRFNWRKYGEQAVEVNIGTSLKSNNRYQIKKSIGWALGQVGKKITREQAYAHNGSFAVIPFRLNNGIMIFKPSNSTKRDITLIRFYSNICNMHTSDYDVVDMEEFLNANYRDLNCDTIIELPDVVNDIIDYIYTTAKTK